MLESWLAARDAASVRAAWAALSPVSHLIGSRPSRTLTLHGAARLAEVMLGERADWIVDVTRPPDYEVDRVVGDTYFDEVWNGPQSCHETWRLWEQRDGARGVQLANIGAGSIGGQPDGGGQVFVRVFDRDRAASIAIDTRRVSTIGDVDLAALDLLRFNAPLAIAPATTTHVETLRGLLGQLGAELDVHFATSLRWPRIDGGGAGADRQAFGEGGRAITIKHDRSYGWILAEVEGLPWGQQLDVHFGIDGGQRYLHGRLPDADIDRVLARHAAIARAPGGSGQGR